MTVKKNTKKTSMKDAKQLSKDSSLMRKSIKMNKYSAASGLSKEMDQTLKSLDKQVSILDALRRKHQNDQDVQRSIKAQKSLIRGQKKTLSKVKGMLSRKRKNQNEGNP